MDVYRDEAIQRWHVQRADSLAEAREWIVGWRGGWAAETGAHWAVVEGKSGILLGRAALKHLKFSDGTADVAYWTVPAARGKSVCPRAVDAMASWALGVAGFQRLDLEHAMGNTASCRVAEKTGFAVEGMRRSAWLLADGLARRARACAPAVLRMSETMRTAERTAYLRFNHRRIPPGALVPGLG